MKLRKLVPFLAVLLLFAAIPAKPQTVTHQAVLSWTAASDAVASSTYNVYRPIARAVVHHDDFVIASCHAQQAANALCRHLAAIPTQNDDGSAGSHIKPAQSRGWNVPRTAPQASKKGLPNPF
jgi:hypothetical protein